MQHSNERSSIPRDKRKRCSENNLGDLRVCGYTNAESMPIYKCSYCKRITTVVESKCYPLSRDLKKGRR